MRMFSRALRILSAVTLFFFCWTFLPLYSFVAYAATKEGPGSRGQGAGDPSQSPLGKGGNREVGETSGERFEKALEAIRENVGRLEKKHEHGEDDKAEREHIRSKRTEIDSLDVELRKEFSATEKKLKDAKLPKEILDRHYKFVKHYEDNLAELKANLTGIEQSAKGIAFKNAIQKTKAHLEKTKPPKKHVPLDPNNLPFQARKAKAPKAPRLKKEEFEKDFPPQRTQRSPRTASNQQDLLSADLRRLTRIFNASGFKSEIHNPKSAIAHKPILVAANGPLSGLLSQSPQPKAIDLPFSVSSVNSVANEVLLSDPILNHESGIMDLAQAAPADTPTPADLAETPEVQFTPEIQVLAAQLNHNPVKIYEWVRNNIEFVPTYGSIQGAQMTMETKLGNAFDTASLLIALLRASGIAARYVYGTVEIPIEKAMNWVGGVADPKMAGTVLATNGVPVTLIKTSGGTYQALQMEHVFVKAFIDYIPSRGAVHKQGDTWIPLDPSYKQYNYTQGIDIQSSVPFDTQSFANQIQSTATINPDGSITNVDSTLVQQTMQDYQTQVQNYIQQNYPNATVGEMIGKKEVVKQEFDILAGTLSYKVIQFGSEFGTIPTNLRAMISFNIPDSNEIGSGLSYTISMPEITGKKITLSYSPAAVNDQVVMELLLPAPHADGTLIQPNELPTSFPSYLINLKPELRIDGQIIVSGTPVMMGSLNSFVVSLYEPGIGISNIDNIAKAGEYFGIGVDTGRIVDTRLSALKTKIETTKSKLETQTIDGITRDDVLGDLLYTTIVTYFGALDASDEIAAKSQNLIRYRVPSLGICSVQIDVQDIFGIPVSASSNSIIMDIDRSMQSVFSKDGNAETVRMYMFASGGVSSTLEHLVPEQMYSTANKQVHGISAVKALTIANDQGVPIYTITKANIATVLPQLQIDGDVKNDINNVVNAGKEVTAPKTNISYNGWTGCGYVVFNTETGAGAYMLSGGYSGGSAVLWWIGYTCLVIGMMALCWAAAIVLGPYIFALEAVIVGAILTASTFIISCITKAINNGTLTEALRQIADIPKRIANAGLNIGTMIASVGYQLLKIWKLTCGQPG